MSDVFKTLSEINVNEHVEKKKGDNGVELSYLSWPWAWATVKSLYPDADYKIWKDVEHRPYTYDENLGYMVYTSVTIQGETKEMWLPVMDNKNKAMRAEEYEYTTRYGKKSVSKASMFDVNTAIMRCLVKNLAMFGLGLYIYAGEDLPVEDKDEEKTKVVKNEATEKPKKEVKDTKTDAATKEQVNEWLAYIKENFDGKDAQNAVYFEALNSVGLKSAKGIDVETLNKCFDLTRNIAENIKTA